MLVTCSWFMGILMGSSLGTWCLQMLSNFFFTCFVSAHLQDTHLVLDGGVDLVESGDARELLRDLLVVGPLLGVLAELNEETIK